MARRLLLALLLGFSLDVLCFAVEINGERDLLGRPANFDKGLLEEWGVPEGAELVLQSETSCGEKPPIRVAAKMAILCDAFTKIRKCMNISEAAPFVWGSECRGRNCTMRLNSQNQAAASACAFRYLVAIEVDPLNQTRRETCGFDPADAYWMTPFVNPANSGDVSCVGSYPNTSTNLIWAECNQQKAPVYVQKMIFEKPPTTGNYTCFDSPQCKDGKRYSAEMVCFKLGGGSRLSSQQEHDKREEVLAMSGTQLGVSQSLILALVLLLIQAIYRQF